MRAVLALGMLVALAACSSDSTPGTATSEPAAQSVDVGTAALARQKARTDVPDCPATTDAGPVADGLPAVTLPCLGGGRAVDLAGLRRTPIVLNLWANYCGPCRDEMPLFDQLHEQAGDRLLVLGLDYADQLPARALALADETGVSYPLVADPDGRTRAELQVLALPQTLFVDSSGTVVATIRREVTSYDELVDLVEQHLQVSL